MENIPPVSPAGSLNGDPYEAGLRHLAQYNAMTPASMTEAGLVVPSQPGSRFGTPVSMGMGYDRLSAYPQPPEAVRISHVPLDENHSSLRSPLAITVPGRNVPRLRESVRLAAGHERCTIQLRHAADDRLTYAVITRREFHDNVAGAGDGAADTGPDAVIARREVIRHRLVRQAWQEGPAEGPEEGTAADTSAVRANS